MCVSVCEYIFTGNVKIVIEKIVLLLMLLLLHLSFTNVRPFRNSTKFVYEFKISNCAQRKTNTRNTHSEPLPSYDLLSQSSYGISFWNVTAQDEFVLLNLQFNSVSRSPSLFAIHYYSKEPGRGPKKNGEIFFSKIGPMRKFCLESICLNIIILIILSKWKLNIYMNTGSNG